MNLAGTPIEPEIVQTLANHTECHTVCDKSDAQNCPIGSETQLGNCFPGK